MPKRKSATNGREPISRASASGQQPSEALEVDRPRPRGRPRTEIDSDAIAVQWQDFS